MRTVISSPSPSPSVIALLALLLCVLTGCQHHDDAPNDSTPDPTDSAPGDSTDSDDTDSDDTDSDDTSSGTPADPFDLAALVDQDTLLADITALQGFGTRYTGTPGGEASRAWIMDELQAAGLPTEEDPFEGGVNVIARLDGTTDPEVIWVFSAHYDSTSELRDTIAPGADDNASGVAAVLSAARIMSQYRFKASIWFVAMGAEEQGSLGSAHLAGLMADQGLDVRGVVAPDMIAYWPLGDADAFDILGDTESESLVNDMAGIADEMGVANKVWIEHRYCMGDDHTSFQDAGFPAISPMDCVEAHNVRGTEEDTPHYHSTSDTVDTLYMPFTARVAQVIVASLATWAEPD